MLQEQIKNIVTQNQKNQKDVDAVPNTEVKETTEDVLQKVMSLCSDVEIDILDMAYDQAHMIGKVYNDKGTNKICKSIIVRFSTFRH